jgi:hypothetical protein
METTIVGPIGIAGHVYHARVEYGFIDGNFIFNILATECVGRWPMSDCSIGDSWIEKCLRMAVEAYFDC